MGGHDGGQQNQYYGLPEHHHAVGNMASEMVGIADAGHGDPNYDLYGTGINASFHNPGGYDQQQYYYGGNDGMGYGMPGNRFDDPNEYGGINYNTDMGGPRKRNVQGGGSGGMKEGDDDQAKVHVEVGNNSSGDENQSLLSKKKVPSDGMPACYKLRRCLGCMKSRERR